MTRKVLVNDDPYPAYYCWDAEHIAELGLTPEQVETLESGKRVPVKRQERAWYSGVIFTSTVYFHLEEIDEAGETSERPLAFIWPP